MDYIDPNTQALVIFCADTATSILSLSGCISLLLTYFLIGDFRTNEIRRLLVILAVVDGLFNLVFLSMLWITSRNDFACRIFTVIVTYLPTSSALWTMCISYTAYRRIIGETWVLSPGLKLFYHNLAWGYPLILCVVMVCFPNYWSQENIGCWIPSRPWRNQIFRLSAYIILWIAWIFNGIIYYRMIKYLHQIMQASSKITSDEQTKRLKWIPISFVVIRVFGSLNAVKDIFSPDTSWFIVNVLEAIGDQAQGFIHGILFVYTNETFQQWVIHAIKYCGKKNYDTSIQGTPFVPLTSSENFDSMHEQPLLGNTFSNCEEPNFENDMDEL